VSESGVIIRCSFRFVVCVRYTGGLCGLVGRVGMRLMGMGSQASVVIFDRSVVLAVCVV
jgi:hypothetical protein